MRAKLTLAGLVGLSIVSVVGIILTWSGNAQTVHVILSWLSPEVREVLLSVRTLIIMLIASQLVAGWLILKDHGDGAAALAQSQLAIEASNVRVETYESELKKLRDDIESWKHQTQMHRSAFANEFGNFRSMFERQSAENYAELKRVREGYPIQQIDLSSFLHAAGVEYSDLQQHLCSLEDRLALIEQGLTILDKADPTS